MKKSKRYFMIYWQKVKKLPNNTAIILVQLYRAVLSPSAGVLRFLPFYPRPSCVFYPTCSEYAISCFKQYPFFIALAKTVKRIGRCHPGTPPSVDMP